VTNDDRKRDDEPDDTHPIDPPVSEDERYRLDLDRDERGSVTDAGRTSGGGSLGHIQPGKVEREAPLRNNAEKRDSDEPTLPSKESSLKTNT
jgi:hypothetical protein